jgi:crossover junction endodeoxyribonuclease RuvC
LLVLGIDPGTHWIGYGLVRAESDRYRALGHGRIEAPKELPFSDRLKAIYHAVLDILDRSKPDVVAVEEVYVTTNAKTTLRLGHARGIILLAAAERGMCLAEYAPREVKQAVAGNGAATKTQVQWMMRQMLDLGNDAISEDETDALAVALCHGYRAKTQSLIGGRR